MARSKTKSKTSVAIFCIIAVILGFIGGGFGITYATLPYNEELIVSEEVYYSYNENEKVNTVPVVIENGSMSIHFLELGNKYTGDCTYIKVGEDIDILIDCGSKSNSISTIQAYLDNYVTDNTLEYVIITHAHQDHYAGFATTEKVSSIFDLYVCENIIDFARTNQKETAKVYGNYLRELEDEMQAGANHFTALDCWNEEFVEQADGETVQAQKEYLLDEVNEISFQILYQKFYEEDASSENDYSVCVMFSHGDRNFLFTGDLEEDGEESLVENNALSKVELYKAGHHGSKTSSSEALLSVIQPQIVCVCCCAGSSEYTGTKDNQFPTQEFINRVAKYTEAIYVTTLCVDYKNDEFTSFNGNIVVTSTASTFGVNCSNNNTILKDSEWFKENRTWSNEV